MNFLDITSTNSTVILTVEDLFPQGVTLEGFSVDTIISSDEVTMAETRMGVDGKMASGYVPSPKSVTISLEANSPSQEVFNVIYGATEATKKIYKCNLSVNVPSLKRSYNWVDGCVVSGKPTSDVKKTLDPTSWKLTFTTLEISRI